MPKLNVDAIKKAIAKRQAEMIGSLGPGGHPRTGTKALVREHLDAILRIRAETGATWGGMVAALRTQYDLRQGDGEPISGRRLSALVSACLKERARETAAVDGRAARVDVIAQANTANPRNRVSPASSTPSPFTTAAASPVVADPPDDTPLSEADILRAQKARSQHLFKRG